MSIYVTAKDGKEWYLDDAAVPISNNKPQHDGWYWWWPPEDHEFSGCPWIVLVFTDDDGLLYQQLHGSSPELVSAATGKWSEEIDSPEVSFGSPDKF